MSGSWSDNHELCTSGCVSGGDVVRLWQAIIWADDVSGSPVSASFIDGQYGSNTASKTRAWQTVEQIGVDGRVGPQTWSEAYRSINRNTGYDTATQTGYVYFGYGRNFPMRKNNSTGVWTFRNPRTNAWTGTSH